MSNLAFEFYRAVKSKCQCIICSTSDGITFHHIDPTKKKNSVSSLARYGTLTELVAEINKCLPLCVDCHKKAHTGHHNGWLKGHFNNGVPSQDWKAVAHMPMLTLENGEYIITKRAIIGL